MRYSFAVKSRFRDVSKSGQLGSLRKIWRGERREKSLPQSFIDAISDQNEVDDLFFLEITMSARGNRSMRGGLA